MSRIKRYGESPEGTRKLSPLALLPVCDGFLEAREFHAALRTELPDILSEVFELFAAREVRMRAVSSMMLDRCDGVLSDRPTDKREHDEVVERRERD